MRTRKFLRINPWVKKRVDILSNIILVFLVEAKKDCSELVEQFLRYGPKSVISAFEAARERWHNKPDFP